MKRITAALLVIFSLVGICACAYADTTVELGYPDIKVSVNESGKFIITRTTPTDAEVYEHFGLDPDFVLSGMKASGTYLRVIDEELDYEIAARIMENDQSSVLYDIDELSAEAVKAIQDGMEANTSDGIKEVKTETVIVNGIKFIKLVIAVEGADGEGYVCTEYLTYKNGKAILFTLYDYTGEAENEEVLDELIRSVTVKVNRSELTKRKIKRMISSVGKRGIIAVAGLILLGIVSRIAAKKKALKTEKVTEQSEMAAEPADNEAPVASDTEAPETAACEMESENKDNNSEGE